MDLIEALKYISPTSCDYTEWLSVGMALKHEGYSLADWDNWSRMDTRYHAGECEQKWQGFNSNASPVTAGTIIQMAKDRGLTFGGSVRELDWDSEISYESENISVNREEGIPISEPAIWNPVKEIVTYLELLFEAGENVGYVTETWEAEKDGKIKYLPTKGACSRTAGELIEELNRCNGDIGAVLGDYKPEAGAWIRFNPLDGKGVKNENVTEFRYALVESDSMPLEQQNAVMRELNLPIAVLVYSGGKSLHAIVKIDAPNYDEYRKRVDYLYKVCKDNGLEIDKQNRNPSRLSRLPGVERNGKRQFIIDTNIGLDNFNEWKDYIESINDDLPDGESLADVWDNTPELSPPLIDGVLRQGHKMLLAGPSKAGKSFGLIELAIAIAEGSSWFGFNCTKGRVLYVNLELDRASCLHRFKDVYKALELPPENISDIDIWNLRGHSVPMDKLAPKLIRRACKKDYIAIIIDPIYKVITGDENSADQMSHFCNQFDKVCTELGCAVIYCHHHSKGSQSGKRSMDRASGSGVFARDPDALLDLVELELSESVINQQTDSAVCGLCKEWLTRFDKHSDLTQDECCSPSAMIKAAQGRLSQKSYKLLIDDIEKIKVVVNAKTAWRIEGTLREFPKFSPINLWFEYPIHRADDIGVLKDCDIEGAPATAWQRGIAKANKKQQQKQDAKKVKFLNAVAVLGGEPTLDELVEYFDGEEGFSERTLRNYISLNGYQIDKNDRRIKQKKHPSADE